VFTKKHCKGLAVTSFASPCLRTHPLLTYIMQSQCNLILICFLTEAGWRRCFCTRTVVSSSLTSFSTLP